MLTKAARETKKKAKEEADAAGFYYANRIEKYNLSSKDPNHSIFDGLCETSKSLYNCIWWRCLQAWKAHEKLPSYGAFDALCKSGEVDYLTKHYQDLPQQVAQQVIIRATTDWSNYFKALKAFKLNPSSFQGRPKHPGCKRQRFQIVIPQSFTASDGFLFFLTKKEIKPIQLWGKHPADKIKQIQINPQATSYQVVVTYQMLIRKEPINDLGDTLKRILGVDLGTNNLLACANNVGLTPFVISGRTMKSLNRFYNKATADAKNLLPRYFTPDGTKKCRGTSKKMRLQWEKRDRQLQDYLHKMSKFLVDYCLYHNLDTLVIGYNQGWKQDVNLGSKNNQNFVYLPFRRFVDILKYKCADAGIIFRETNESYTSKCSFLDNEPLQHQEKYLGRRIKRGLFRSSQGYILNADINGALNIIRKVFPNAFDSFAGKWDRGCGLHPVKLSGLSRLTSPLALFLQIPGNRRKRRAVSSEVDASRTGCHLGPLRGTALTKMEMKDLIKLPILMAKPLKIVNSFI